MWAECKRRSQCDACDGRWWEQSQAKPSHRHSFFNRHHLSPSQPPNVIQTRRFLHNGASSCGTIPLPVFEPRVDVFSYELVCAPKLRLEKEGRVHRIKTSGTFSVYLEALPGADHARYMMNNFNVDRNWLLKNRYKHSRKLETRLFSSY